MNDVGCPYCGERALLVNDSQVYHGRSYGGMVWWCQPCDAWVGCHKGTDKPLGSLANASLRAARQLAHERFDTAWKKAGLNRTEAYRVLAKILKCPENEAHIGKCSAPQCITIVAACDDPGTFKGQRKPGLNSIEALWPN